MKNNDFAQLMAILKMIKLLRGTGYLEKGERVKIIPMDNCATVQLLFAFPP